MVISRRSFVLMTMAPALLAFNKPRRKIVTVKGVVSAMTLKRTLAHEHVMVDFIGADQTNEKRWDKNEVVNRAMPYFAEVKALGVNTIVECTPAFLGRDVRMLKMLSDKTKMHIITNTGYYGADNNKYLPPWAFTETAEQLGNRWTDEFDYGIDGTDIRPGFIKISVDAADTELTEIHKKLVRAAAITHLRSGLTIYSHTGAGKAAFEQLELLKGLKVSPNAFVWVHAQVEKNKQMYLQAAKMGAWVSLDGITNDFDDYADSLNLLKSKSLLNRVLISHDAGYYRPGEKDGGEFTPYTTIFEKLIPLLKQKGFTDDELDQLLIKNPRSALELEVRRLR